MAIPYQNTVLLSIPYFRGLTPDAFVFGDFSDRDFSDR
jgi:hypothetical protein